MTTSRRFAWHTPCPLWRDWPHTEDIPLSSQLEKTRPWTSQVPRALLEVVSFSDAQFIKTQSPQRADCQSQHEVLDRGTGLATVAHLHVLQRTPLEHRSANAKHATDRRGRSFQHNVFQQGCNVVSVTKTLGDVGFLLFTSAPPPASSVDFSELLKAVPESDSSASLSTGPSASASPTRRTATFSNEARTSGPKPRAQRPDLVLSGRKIPSITARTTRSNVNNGPASASREYSKGTPSPGLAWPRSLRQPRQNGGFAAVAR